MPGKYTRPGTAVKQTNNNKSERSSVDQQQKLYRSLHDQLDRGHFDNALKTCTRLLRCNPSDALAAQTRIQILIALDRYPEALTLVQPESDNLTRAYCLYKTGRESEAKAVLDQLPNHERDAQLLQAQVNYRLENYEQARDQFEDLAAMVQDDSPEFDDLETNIAACNSHLDFLSAVPSHLASGSNVNGPSIEDLESTPVGPLVQSNPALRASNAHHNATASSSRLAKSKSAAAAGSTAATTAAAAKQRTPKRLPKNYDPAKTPDPWRWTKLKERPGMGEVIQSKREKARGRNKDRAAKEKAALLTQGGLESPLTGGGAGTGAKNSTSSGGGTSKKKKGKK